MRRRGMRRRGMNNAQLGSQLIIGSEIMAYPEYPETEEEYRRLVDLYWKDLVYLAHRFSKHTEREMLKLKEKDDLEGLSRIFHKIWWGMPDQEWVRIEPGFFVLCDLCSEDYVLRGES
jgi:hypothetical protein